MANVAHKYALALYKALNTEEEINHVHKDFNESLKVFRNVNEIDSLFKSPNISKENKKEMVKNAFVNAHPKLVNLFYVLIDKNRFDLLEDVHEMFNKVYNKHYNQEYVIIESVYSLSDEEIQQIGKHFVKISDYKKLLIENKVKEDLIGGIKVHIGTKVYDGSIKGQLDDMRHQFRKSTS